MRSRPRPASAHGPHAAPPPTPRPAALRPARKVFNCIVDDTALVAGVKRSTRNGIRQWVKHGHMRLFVPLHALDELSRQKTGHHKHAEDVRHTLRWLDDATTKSPHVVALQGADETYDRWAQVEKFAVPRTLFSENNHEHELGLVESNQSDPDPDPDTFTPADNDKRAAHATLSASSAASDRSRSLSPSSVPSLHSSASPVSPPTSPPNPAVSPTQHMASLVLDAGGPTSSSASVPRPLQPLFNYILWRIHQEMDPVAALESFIFLCNDPTKFALAKGFDIKTKRLEQLREAIGREDRDYRNRLALQNRESQNLQAGDPHTSTTHEKPDDEEEVDGVPFEPPTAPAAMLHRQPPNTIDPNAFSRAPQPPTSPKMDQPDLAPTSPRPPHLNYRGSPRATHALTLAPHANARARGPFRGGPRDRGAKSPGPGRGGLAKTIPPAENSAPQGSPIDPNSFMRPLTRGHVNSTRGARKLWVPT